MKIHVVNFIFILYELACHFPTSGAFKDRAPFGSDLEEVRVVAGYNATLPCRVPVPANDAPVITLWYISHEEAPVYSFDMRQSEEKGSHWADPDVFASRAFYHAQWTPPSLELVKAQSKDGHLYRCRVDFAVSNSKEAWVRLDIIVPPNNIEIEVKKKRIQFGESRDVVCKAIGGTPSPQVIWLQNGEEVDGSFNSSSGRTYNVLDIPASRKDLFNPFVCQAINNDLQRPEDAIYTRNVSLEPLAVTITTLDEPLSEGRTATLHCTVVGSNPPATVVWYHQGVVNKTLLTQVRERVNITTSTLTINTTRHDNGAKLVCKAFNQLLKDRALEASYYLNVAFKPVVNLQPGRTINASNLREGNDVYFECAVEANPPPYKVEWLHDGVLIKHNKSIGILVAKSSLVLQSIGLGHSGSYKCKVSNVEGDTTSEPIQINIKYAPRCSVAPQLKGVALREPVGVNCTVNADPTGVQFVWTFNNSVRKELSEVVPSSRFTSSGLTSTLVYTPLTERDYGTLLCYGKNSVGKQAIPCSFTVISAGPPESAENCTVENITSHSGSVTCYPGFNGGLPQKFLLQVWSEDGEQVVNFSSSNPEFSVRSLSAGTPYIISVTAYNSRGKAKHVKLALHTMKEAEMHKSLPSRAEPSALTMVLGVIGGALLVVLSPLFAMWAIRCRRRQGHIDHNHSCMQKKMSMKTSDPDILPGTGGGNSGRPLLEHDYDPPDPHFNRHGRPIHISPNPHEPLSDGQISSSESIEMSKIAATSLSSSASGIGRGISLGPVGLEASISRRSGSGNSQNVGKSGNDPPDRRKGCTRRVALDRSDLAGSPCLHQPLIQGDESIL